MLKTNNQNINWIPKIVAIFPYTGSEFSEAQTVYAGFYTNMRLL